MTYAAAGVGVAATAKTGYELITGKEAFTGRELGTLEKWEMGGELIGGIVGGGRMVGGKKGSIASLSKTAMSDIPVTEPISRSTSNATEPAVFSEPTRTATPKFTEPTSSGTTKYAEPIRTSEVESATTTLLRMEAENPGAHFVSRHDANTTLQEQYIRSTTGLTPDGFQGRPLNSTRFLSEIDQLEAANIATEHFQRTGESSFSFDMGRVIGEGYMKRGGERMESTKVKAYFRNNKLYTMYPQL